MKSLFFITIFILSQCGFAADHASNAPLLGVHGMAALHADGKFYASHMPLANSIHAHQVVFSFTLDESNTQALSALNKDYVLITMVPEVFDLAQLMNGSLDQFKANFHANHFERGGGLEMSEVIVKVEKLLLAEPLMGGHTGRFYSVRLNERLSMYVHQIGRLPSFDQILLSTRGDQQDDDSESVVKLTSDSPWTVADEPTPAIYSIYLETKDFQ